MKRFVVAAVAALVLAAPAVAGKPAFSFRASAPGTVKAGSAAVALRVRSSEAAELRVTLYRSGRKLATWQTSVAAGAERVRLALAPRSRTPGRYTLLLRASTEAETVFRTLRFRITT